MTYRLTLNKHKRIMLMMSFFFLTAALTHAAALGSGQTDSPAASNLPPIDAAVPSEFKTASFGLG